MREQFPIIKVESEWVLEPEEMGSKRKFWYRPPGEHQRRWLFKCPQDNTGQHWAEKIAAEISEIVGIRRAAVDLAMFDGQQGSVSKSFVHSGLELVHGNQILSTLLPSYDPTKRFHQANHTPLGIYSLRLRSIMRPHWGENFLTIAAIDYWKGIA
jgi:hypothetical protein